MGQPNSRKWIGTESIMGVSIILVHTAMMLMSFILSSVIFTTTDKCDILRSGYALREIWECKFQKEKKKKNLK